MGIKDSQAKVYTDKIKKHANIIQDLFEQSSPSRSKLCNSLKELEHNLNKLKTLAST